MTSLMDIGPLTKQVKVRGVDLTVRGLSVLEVFHLLVRFVDLRALMESKEIMGAKLSTPEGQGVIIRMIIGMAPQALAAVLVACSGQPYLDDDDLLVKQEKQARAEVKAMQLGVADAIAILEPAVDFTFREEGVGPFVDQLMSLAKLLGVSGQEPVTSSPERSAASLQLDITPRYATPGRTRHVN